MGKHLTDDATIRGALRELIEGNGWVGVITTLDFLLADPSRVDDEGKEHITPIPAPMSVDISFPRRRTLAEDGMDPSDLYLNDN